MTEADKLNTVREQIDAIDRDLVALINKRANLALEIAGIKQQSGDNNQFYRPEREAQKLRSVIDGNCGPMEDEELARIFREIMSACLAMEKKLTIAYLGPEGTFTQAAALKHFGASVQSRAFPGIDQVFREVEAKSCAYGVVPIENSIEGVVNHTLDMFIDSELTICGEVHLPIHQNLLGMAASLNEIRLIYSHQLSFAQCRKWLDKNLPNAERIHVTSNAEAARQAAEDGKIAAIAGEGAAHVYRLPVLASNIEDDPNNTTRFLVISREPVLPSGDDKTTVLFSMPSKPGSLIKMLSCFASNNVNMTRIESRPSRQAKWEYVFFVDLEGHATDENLAASLKQIADQASMTRLLGSYPTATL